MTNFKMGKEVLHYINKKEEKSRNGGGCVKWQE